MNILFANSISRMYLSSVRQPYGKAVCAVSIDRKICKKSTWLETSANDWDHSGGEKVIRLEAGWINSYYAE